MENYYIRSFNQKINSGYTNTDAAIAVIEAYLDGKPKQTSNAVSRNADFWSCHFLADSSVEVYESEPFVLALARYLNQENTANFELIAHVAMLVPEVMRRAIRYSGVVLRQNSERWTEVERLSIDNKTEFGEIVRICHVMKDRHQELLGLIEMAQESLDHLSPFEVLIYASLLGFATLDETNEQEKEEEWAAYNAIIAWKLRTCSLDVFHLTEKDIALSARLHLSPWLFPSPKFPVGKEQFKTFLYLFQLYMKLNSFMEQSVDAFCFDDSVHFRFSENSMEIILVNTELKDAWIQNNEKLKKLNCYWTYRALDQYTLSKLASKQIGSAENHLMNQMAIIKTFQSYLHLQEVYGVDTSIQTETGLKVDLFQAILSMELMSAFFNMHFIQPYKKNLAETGDWSEALGKLAFDGLLTGTKTHFENRFPITWSDKIKKINRILAWTVNKEFPNGNAKAAEAILDFWTFDFGEISAKMHREEKVQTPHFFERPVIKMGRYLFQLPWMIAYQNNSSAAINNLRRIGARRVEVRRETEQIEFRLAENFKQRGFNVCLNYHPEKNLTDNPGEVDLIVFLDRYLLIIEVKSSFLRSSMKEAFIHKTTTLRKAGLQLERKVKAIQLALETDRELINSLNINVPIGSIITNGWIVDTSIEHDHEYFSGFLKVSIEEVLIALRDDAYLLNDSDGVLGNKPVEKDAQITSEIPSGSTLYPEGFSAKTFIKVIENQAVWK